ncbi:MAG: M67 family metallopeptidase [Firmicutes bacterium]|nr:M67 family metallopeptidase [Bacillota bacterium]
MIYISKDLLKEIESNAERRYPNECCGIIFGKTENDIKYAESVKEINNSFGDGEEYHRFLITAEDMMKSELYAREKGIDIVGFYHSHPNAEAVPSEYDRVHALPIYSYPITSVVNGKVMITKSYELYDNKFIEEEIKYI